MSTSFKASARTALILLYDTDGRFLLQHRTPDAPVIPDYWGFFGGHIKDGETVEAALYRETFEELRYRLSAPVFLLEQDFRIDALEGHMHVFVEALAGEKSALELLEGQGWGWFTVDEIAPLKMMEHDRSVVRSADTHIKRLGNNER